MLCLLTAKKTVVAHLVAWSFSICVAFFAASARADDPSGVNLWLDPADQSLWLGGDAVGALVGYSVTSLGEHLIVPGGTDDAGGFQFLLAGNAKEYAVGSFGQLEDLTQLVGYDPVIGLYKVPATYLGPSDRDGFKNDVDLEYGTIDNVFFGGVDVVPEPNGLWLMWLGVVPFLHPRWKR